LRSSAARRFARLAGGRRQSGRGNRTFVRSWGLSEG